MPVTVAVHVDVCVVKIAPGAQFTVTPVIVEDAFTATAALPDFVASCVDVALMVAVPNPLGVNTPALLTVPAVDGLTDQVTAELKLPLPVTFALQADVCVMRIALGTHVTVTAEMVEPAPTGTVALPDFDASCTEVAVTVAFPAPVGVNTPPAVIVPFVAVHVTALLKLPVPETAAVHAVVWFGKIDAGLHVTLTDEIVEVADDPFTATLAVEDLLVSCVDVAVTVAVPAPDGVNKPACVIVPFVAVQLTDVLNPPVPKTVAEHWLDWPV